jgi:16S rRNA (guanine527-N7)-methyltransferase
VDREPSGERCREFFGAAWDVVSAYAEVLAEHGEIRGLLGPREKERLWSRHLLNSAAAAAWLPGAGLVIDLGSGAGLPGIVLAALRGDLAFELVEPMERRVAWLNEVVAAVGLGNVVVTRARAEELAGRRAAEAVTARAVAPVGKLARLAGPLLAGGGRLVALKGRRAAEELADGRKALQAAGLVEGAVHEVVVLPELEPTYLVTARSLTAQSGRR